MPLPYDVLLIYVPCNTKMKIHRKENILPHFYKMKLLCLFEISYIDLWDADRVTMEKANLCAQRIIVEAILDSSEHQWKYQWITSCMPPWQVGFLHIISLFYRSTQTNHSAVQKEALIIHFSLISISRNCRHNPKLFFIITVSKYRWTCGY